MDFFTHPLSPRSIFRGKSLAEANLQSAMIEKDGRAEKIFVEANPQFKSINIYDSQMQPVLDKSLKKTLNSANSLDSDPD